MKIFNILLLGVLCSSYSFAQISIDAADAPAVGTILFYGQDTLITEVGPGGDGEGLTWDFSGFVADVNTTTVAVAPETTPSFDLFPSADVVLETEGLYSYAEISDMGLLGLGGSALQQGVLFTVAFDPPQQLLANPTTLGTTFENEFGFELEADGSLFGVDSVRVRETGDEQGTVTATGTVMVPAGEFEVLRLTKTSNTIDSIWVKFFGSWIFVEEIVDSSVTYEWWAEGGLSIVATMEAGVDGIPTSIEFLTDFSFPAVEPVAAFSSEPAGNFTVQFTDESSNNPTEWLWDFGDGNTSTMQNPAHNYAVAGTYTVCLIATNTAGSNTICQPVSTTISSVENLEEGKTAYLYPNPATDWIHLYAEDIIGKQGTFTIYSINGQLIEQWMLQHIPENCKYNVGSLDNGNYILEITVENRPYKTLPFSKL